MRLFKVLRFSIALIIAVASVLFFTLASVQAKSNAVELPAIAVDANTGNVLYANRADEIRAPASITKVMTLYLVFDAIQSGRLSWNTEMPVSKYAASKPRMKLGLPAGSRISVRDAVNAMIVLSANDAAVVAAEYLGGSEENFARVMTLKARSLGMRNTTFRNANGLPAQGHVSTARDIALMSIAMRDHFPQYYHLFSQREFSYRGQVYKGHNRVLDRIDGADGLKTGFTGLAGFTITTTIAKDGKKLVVVVLGGTSGRQRDDVVVLLANAYMGSASRSTKKRIFAQWNVAQSAWRGQPQPKNVQPDTNNAEIVTASVSQRGNRATEPAKTVVETRSTISIPVKKTVKVETSPTTMAYADDSKKTVTDILKNEMSGNYIVQVAALPDKGSAEGFLKTIKKSLSDTNVASLGHVEPATVDGKRVYRVRFGSFGSESEANAACGKITAQAYSCFVVAN
ncbi:Sporulation-like domain [Bartonella choladocola]|uniref:serine hydrolase n=1 Tax=Bartonella TaxID=773 RepID=UPI0018DB3787|nr:serine hydrolase [Bartonella choladocola]MBI0139556.1 D-alanyl-D-alanine carboxypeptidase [Bartonella choladocola]